MDIKKLDLSINEFCCWNPHKGNDGGMRISWSGTNGWGQYDIFKEKNKKNILAASECMDLQEDKSFITELFNILINKLSFSKGISEDISEIKILDLQFEEIKEDESCKFTIFFNYKDKNYHFSVNKDGELYTYNSNKVEITKKFVFSLFEELINILIIID